MTRVLIIGGNGSGKSTFAKQLHAITSLPLVHLDRLLWYGDWQVRKQEEFDALLEAELGKAVTVVATGGIAPKIISHCRNEIIYDEDLLLKGLHIIYKKNKK